MFRSKKKSSGGGAGSAQRKRKAAAVDEDDVIGPAAATGDEGGGDEAADEEVDDALLQRMRARHNSGSSVRNRRATISSARPPARVSAGISGGGLSFEAESETTKTRIQPNLLPDGGGASESEDLGASAYSREALAALRQQQNILLRGDVREWEKDETSAQQVNADTGLDELDGATVVVDEEVVEGGGASPEAAEEFIPLRSQLLQARKKRSRVTFGVQETVERPAQNPEVVEVEEDNEEDDDEGRRWEEDIMRRGGLRAQSAFTDTPKDFVAAKGETSAYPTRTRVPTGSLAGVLAKLQRALDAANFENDRAERELARIDAEMKLITESEKMQREQLLAASEEFEYFQVVEDYVKGLSFCLREKTRELDASESEVAKLRVENVRSIREADAKCAQDVANKLTAVGAIVSSDVHGLQIFEADRDCVLPSMGSASVDNELAEMLKRGFTDRTPAIRQESDGALDVFADAIDDMNSLEHVYGRFQEWRTKFPLAYASCYCDLALEKLYAPYVRAELLFWDPLSVCAASSSGGTPWGFSSFKWRSVLLQHVTAGADDDGPVAVLVRDVVLSKTLGATTLYFDPFSSLHTRSLCLLLEEVGRHARYAEVSALVLRRVVKEAATQFVAAAKLVPLVAIREELARANRSSSAATLSDFAAFQLGRFNALLDNVLTFFVALPRDAAAESNQTAGFRCVMQVLHQLLAYLSHCQRAQKTLLVPQAVLTVSQLTASPYLQQLLASSSQEQELHHVLTLFAPFCSTTKTT